MNDAVLPHLRCPNCGSVLTAALGAGRPLRCARGHSFDIAKQGYATLTAGRTPHTGDSAEMIADRERFLAAGHYAFIADALAVAAAQIAPALTTDPPPTTTPRAAPAPATNTPPTTTPHAAPAPATNTPPTTTAHIAPRPAGDTPPTTAHVMPAPNANTPHTSTADAPVPAADTPPNATAHAVPAPAADAPSITTAHAVPALDTDTTHSTALSAVPGPVADALASVHRGLDLTGTRASAAGLVVDAGTGTGYYLARVLDALPAAVGLGLDVSKPALRRAARSHPRADAALADLWQPLPLADQSAALILDVFAPRNGAEFHRVLHPDGALLVVTPAADHLTELIAAYGLIGVDPDKAERVADNLGTGFVATATTTHRHRMHLTRDEVRTLIGMTPSARHVPSATVDPTTPTEVTAAIHLTTYRRA